MDEVFHLKAPFQPTGDQPQAIEALVQGIHEGEDAQTAAGRHRPYSKKRIWPYRVCQSRPLLLQ